MIFTISFVDFLFYIIVWWYKIYYEVFFILKGVVLFMKTFTFGELSKDVRKHVVEYVYDSNSFLDRVENSLTDDLFYSFVVPISASFVINKENKKPVFLIDSFSFSLDKDILEYALTEEDNKLFSLLKTSNWFQA